MSNLLRATLSISAATVLSRVTGYGRWMAMAAVLGAGAVAESYSAAAVLPSRIYELFLGGIMYSIFIPVLVERMTNHGEDDARSLTNALFTIILPLMAVVTLVGILFAEPLVTLATNWDNSSLPPEEIARRTELAVLFFRIFAVQMLFYGVTTIATGVLQSHRRFFLATFAPVLNNVITIGSFLAFPFLVAQNQTLAYYVLAGGATIGVAVMTLALVPTLLSLGYVPRPQLGHPALLPTLKLAGPMVILVAASVGFQALGTFLVTEFDSQADLAYAFVIFSVPYGIFTVAISTALMPELSEQHALGDSESYRASFSLGLRSIAFVLVPAAVGMGVLAEPIVGLLYERGAFGIEQTRNVATLLTAYSLGLVGYSVYFFMVRAFYSRQNTKTPAALNVVILVAYAGLAYTLKYFFQAPGIVLALSAAYTVLALLSLAATRREIGYIDGRRLALSLAKISVAGMAMYTVARLGVAALGTGTVFWERILTVTLVGGISSVAYLGVALLLRAEELGYVRSLLSRRLSRRRAAKSSGE